MTHSSPRKGYGELYRIHLIIKAGTVPFFLHFGSEKPIAALHIVLKDTTIPTICPMIGIKDRVQGTNEALKKPPPTLPTSRCEGEEEKMSA